MKKSVKELVVQVVGSKYEVKIERLLKENQGIVGLLKLSEEELVSKGCTSLLASKIVSFKELHQCVSKEVALTKYTIASPASAANVYMEEMRYLEKEYIKVVFLDTKNGIIDDKDISIGTVNTSLVDPREVFKEALIKKAVHIILIHNHPSGDPTPSQDDIEVTRRVLSASKIIGVNLVDHIVIGDGKYISIREKGLGGF